MQSCVIDSKSGCDSFRKTKSLLFFCFCDYGSMIWRYDVASLHAKIINTVQAKNGTGVNMWQLVTFCLHNIFTKIKMLIRNLIFFFKKIFESKFSSKGYDNTDKVLAKFILKIKCSIFEENIFKLLFLSKMLKKETANFLLPKKSVNELQRYKLIIL